MVTLLGLDYNDKGVCGEFDWVWFLVVCFLWPIPTHEKLFAVGKKVAQTPLLT